MESTTVFGIREISERLRRSMERTFPYLWVRGEVTNLSRPSSGHVYFGLKEGDALLSCVWFRSQQRSSAFDPLTGEVWQDGPRPSLSATMENGQLLICAGRLTAYGARSQYQLVVDLAQDGGQGLWHLEFEALKRRLAGEGLFDAGHKRPIPSSPRRVAVVTAPTGAAIRDFLRIASTRGLGSEIRIFPTSVQGADAPAGIVSALGEAGAGGWAEVIVLIRGGGSAEDLHAFNDEGVARAVYGAPVPVLAGIGHEIDHSIADFAADFSAATPSHTAQLLWAERSDMAQGVDELERLLRRAASSRIEGIASSLGRAEQSLSLLSPMESLRMRNERLASSVMRMRAALDARITLGAGSLGRLETALSAAPAAVKDRQAALDTACLRLRHAGDAILAGAERRAESAEAALLPLRSLIGLREQRALDAAAARLEALDPFAPLKRGYAVAADSSGTVLHDASSLSPGDSVTVTLAEGSFTASVTSVTPSSGERP